MSEKRFSDVEFDYEMVVFGDVEFDYEMVVFEDNNELIILSEDGLCDFLNQLNDENKQLKQENEQLRKRNHEILKELYCKDRKLEEMGISIECCDKDE